MQTRAAADVAATNDLNSGATVDPAGHADGELNTVLKAQRRQRRLRFWAGFLAILIIGGLWAGLTKDPAGPGLFDGDMIDRGFAEAEPAEFFADEPMLTTTAVFVDEPATTVPPTATSVVSTTEGP